MSVEKPTKEEGKLLVILSLILIPVLSFYIYAIFFVEDIYDPSPTFEVSYHIILTFFTILIIIGTSLGFLYKVLQGSNEEKPPNYPKIRSSEERENRKEEKGRLKEARSTYERSKKEFIKGKITKEELKTQLKPYKNELAEMGLIKVIDEEK